MTLSIIITKVEGENRKPDASGKLVATQHAKYQAVVRGAGGHIIFRAERRPSASSARKQIDEAFGPLIWHGATDPDGNNYGIATVEVQANRTGEKS